ncbi:UPF0272 protein [Clostridia bacterium]|nr:UPF0272 protein [Clostridia bacterium]
MKILYFDCFSGISGDMTLGALTDLGVPVEYLTQELEKLHVHGWQLQMERTQKNGISANYAKVILHEHTHEHEHHHHDHDHEHDHEHHEHHHHEHEHRSFADIKRIIEESGISQNAKNIAVKIFTEIANAEGKIHGAPPEQVHFHEVGAVDSIVDVIGSAICVDYLAPDKILRGVVNDGSGFTICQHGQIPIPAPAVAEMFAAKGVRSRQIDVDKELVTPTGAGILAALSEYAAFDFTPKKTGYGAGTRNLSIPNVLRVYLCEEEQKPSSEKVTVIETNVDDETPEILAYTSERLFETGALDVFFTPVFMKKNRAASKITVLCKKADTEKLADILFNETSTIGVRIREEERLVLTRELKTVKTKFGDISVKEVEFSGKKRVYPEYEDAKRAAKEHNVPLREIYNAVKN